MLPIEMTCLDRGKNFRNVRISVITWHTFRVIKIESLFQSRYRDRRTYGHSVAVKLLVRGMTG